MSTSNRLAEIRSSLKFHKSFRDEESKAKVLELKKEEKAILDAEAIARFKFQEILIEEGFTYEECANMSLVELRDAVDEARPLMIINSSATMRGGKTKKVTIVRAKAA